MKNSVWAVLAAFLWMASPAGGDPGDERILLAKDAARSGDRNRLALYAPPTGHPLDPYPEYWALSAHVARPGDINPLPILDFLERQRGSLLAERLSGWHNARGRVVFLLFGCAPVSEGY
jgi:soluble lytic murein transglycosylase